MNTLPPPPPVVEAQIINHWTAGEVSLFYFLLIDILSFYIVLCNTSEVSDMFSKYFQQLYIYGSLRYLRH